MTAGAELGPVLVVAPTNDIHARAVAETLQRRYDTEAIVWDTEAVGSGDMLTFATAPDTQLSLLSGRRGIDMSGVRSVWWRRPRRYGAQVGTMAEEMRRFCAREYDSLLLGGLAAAGVRVVNEPHHELAAQRKPYQLGVAARLGLKVPETIVTNDPDTVREFWLAHDRDCVYKTLTPTPNVFRETRALTPADLDELHLIRLAPIIVQRRLHGVNLRVTVIGRDVFSAVADVARADAELDWRLDLTCTWRPYDLYPVLRHRLQELVARLGLSYGCLDLRFDADNQLYFLEINPAGQFLFVEVDTRAPIVDAMCRLLLNTEPGQVEDAVPSSGPDHCSTSTR